MSEASGWVRWHLLHPTIFHLLVLLSTDSLNLSQLSLFLIQFLGELLHQGWMVSGFRCSEPIISSRWLAGIPLQKLPRLLLAFSECRHGHMHFYFLTRFSGAPGWLLGRIFKHFLDFSPNVPASSPTLDLKSVISWRRALWREMIFRSQNLHACCAHCNGSLVAGSLVVGSLVALTPSISWLVVMAP